MGYDYSPKLPLFGDYRDLFERYYMVRFNALAARSAESIKKYGVRSSGVPEIDREVPGYVTTSELTINAMFEMWRNGVTVSLVNYSDCAEIYEIIQNHITASLEYIDNTINGSKKELLLDMVDLDKFASVVYDKAKSIFSDRDRRSVHDAVIKGLPSINLFNIFGSNTSTITEVKHDSSGKQVVIRERNATHVKKGEIREREGLAEAFIERIEKIGGIGALNGKAEK